MRDRLSTILAVIGPSVLPPSFFEGSVRAECSRYELPKFDCEGVTKGIDLAISLLSLDLQRDEHRDNRGDQCDQPSDQGLPMIDKIDDSCVVPRQDGVFPPDLVTPPVPCPARASIGVAKLIIDATV